MIVLDASVALKWFVTDEPLRDEALQVLDRVQREPEEFLVPEFFMNEVQAVLCRLPGASADRVSEAMGLLERLGLKRVANGHELLYRTAKYAFSWNLSAYDALYVALAALIDGIWLTADHRAAAKVSRRSLVQVLGS